VGRCIVFQCRYKRFYTIRASAADLNSSYFSRVELVTTAPSISDTATCHRTLQICTQRHILQRHESDEARLARLVRRRGGEGQVQACGRRSDDKARGGLEGVLGF
jgi:hypothetical protein